MFAHCSRSRVDAGNRAVRERDSLLPSSSQRSSLSPSPLRQTLLLAVWFALLTGLVEGVFLLGIFGYGWLNVGIRRGVSPQIIWICVACDLVIFGFVALVLLAARRLLTRLPFLPLAFSIFAFFMFFDWGALPLRLRTLSVVVLACG